MKDLFVADPELEPGVTAPPPRGWENRRGRNVILVVPILLLLITFLFWYQTWFGRQLTDREMEEYLIDTSVPHKTQHALAQLAEKIARGDAAAKRWYPDIIKLAQNNEAEFRLMAAWVMGQDNKSEEFRYALRKLVEDPQPMVRSNAALALVRFDDAAGEPQLRLMLNSYTLVAPGGGTVKFRLRARDAVDSGSVVARLLAGDRATSELRSPVTGEIERLVATQGASVRAGDPIAIIAPGEEQVWESLRALFLVGQPDALEDVDRFWRGGSGLSDRVKQQAALTAQAIRKRAVTSGR
jgi:HEAT repeat protein